MKAEHGRPPVETSQPAASPRVVKVMQLPDFKKKWAGRIALTLAIIFAVVAVIINRVNSSRATAAAAADRLAEAGRLVRDIRSDIPTSSEPLNEKFVNRLKAAAEEAKRLLDDTVGSTSDAALLGAAAVNRGDLSLALAHLPPIPGATSRPALELPESREQLSAHAADAYNEVLAKYTEEPLNVAAARFGLAAIAEDKNDWDTAKKNYQAVIDAAVSPSITQTAQDRIALLSKINRPALLVPGPTTALITPTTQPAATQPGMQPTTAPTTRATTRPIASAVKAPTTAPATAPAKSANPK